MYFTDSASEETRMEWMEFWMRGSLLVTKLAKAPVQFSARVSLFVPLVPASSFLRVPPLSEVGDRKITLGPAYVTTSVPNLSAVIFRA